MVVDLSLRGCHEKCAVKLWWMDDGVDCTVILFQGVCLSTNHFSTPNTRHQVKQAKNHQKEIRRSTEFRYGESNPGLAGLMLCLRAADASHYTITDVR
jgi:hypothetical protein